MDGCEKKAGSRSLQAPSPSIGRSSKGRAPLPPIGTTGTSASGCRVRAPSFTEGTQSWQFSIPFSHKNHYHICPEFRTYNYLSYPSPKVRFYQVGYNTNLKKPTENWVRTKRSYHARGGESARRSHTSHSYSHYYAYEQNWLSYAFTPRPAVQSMKYSVPSSWKSRKQFLSHYPAKSQTGMHNFDSSLCMCCVCCNCAKTNQTNCCCCYHCVHTISSCRRSDVLRMIPFPAEPSTTQGAIVSILKKKGSDGIKLQGPPEIKELDQSYEQEFYLDEKSHCFTPVTPDSGTKLLEGQESKAESGLLATAPSPTLSATPTTEPTELDLDEVRGTLVEPVSA